MTRDEELFSFLEFTEEQKRSFTHEEEHDLIVQYKHGDMEALEKLVLAYLWTAPKVADTMCQSNNTTLSLRHVEEAVNSLRIAVEAFPMSGSVLEYAESVIAEKLQLMIHSEQIRFI